MQSVLDLNDKKSKYLRILKFNPKSKESTMYVYKIDEGYAKNSDAKLGAISFIEKDKFLVIEQGKQKGKMQNLVYRIDLKNATEIPNNEDLEFDKIWNLKPVEKHLVLDLRKYGWDIEKAEGLAIVNQKKLAIVNDNDFGITVKIKDEGYEQVKIQDYIYNNEEKELLYKGKKSNTEFSLEVNSKNERKSQLWLFTFEKDINSL